MIVTLDHRTSFNSVTQLQRLSTKHLEWSVGGWTCEAHWQVGSSYASDDDDLRLGDETNPSLEPSVSGSTVLLSLDSSVAASFR